MKGFNIVIIGIMTSNLFSKTPGTSTAEFLKIAPGPRAVAMGNAFVGVADDGYCAYWNPAGISNLERISISSMQLNYIVDMKYFYASFIYPSDFGWVGLYYSSFDSGSIERYTNTGEPAGSFTANDNAIGVVYAKKSDKFAYGFTIKSISLKIDDANTSSVGIDLGTLYKLTENVNLGLAIQNLGGKIKLNQELDSQPLNIKFGTGISIFNQLKLAADINIPNDSKIWIGFGGEYGLIFKENFKTSFRAGYRTGVDWGSMGGLGAGIGIEFKNISVDLTWVPVPDLEETTVRFGISLGF